MRQRVGFCTNCTNQFKIFPSQTDDDIKCPRCGAVCTNIAEVEAISGHSVDPGTVELSKFHCVEE